ncbi:MAG: methionine gamma-lyase family protein [Clostridiales bacterium]|jgi:cystathionine beta-lyase family protein involved in aluminum resistance|nr:methionine gamma-lyase family protein [Clostridiales bacterium]
MINESLEFLKKNFAIKEKILKMSLSIENKICDKFLDIDKISDYNQLKVLNSFLEHKVSYTNFTETTGYGYDDYGRDTLEKIYAKIFGCEDALVRHNIISGTHAISLCIFGVLRPNDNLLCATGKPYDTLIEVLGLNNSRECSLKSWGINCFIAELDSQNKIQYEKISKILKETNPKAILIQKSKGYNFRPSFSNEEIEKIIKITKKWNEECICIVDNCYGEFVELKEPTEFGADLIAGSLIKNLGGGFVDCGGYVAGKKKYVEKASYNLTTVGIGKHAGASLGFNKNMYRGLFNAPHAVNQSLKSALFCSEIFSELGFEICPKTSDKRTDIVQAIKLGSAEKVIKFCQTIQKNSPVDSHLTLLPSRLPGYVNDIIMASGSFVQGSSIEMSADAPIIHPYVVYFQGGTIFSSAKIAIMKAASEILDMY